MSVYPSDPSGLCGRQKYQVVAQISVLKISVLKGSN